MDGGDDLRLDLGELTTLASARLVELGLDQAPLDGRVAAAADARTVRYYTSLGLVDRPVDYQGNKARYGERSLLQLVAIKALQRHHRPLADIQVRLYGLSVAELRVLVQGLGRAADVAATPVAVTRWREVVLAPGLKLLAGDAASLDDDEARLVERFRAALAALRRAGASEAVS